MLPSLSPLQITALVLCFVVPTVGWALLFWRVYKFTALYRAGAPDPTRTGQPGARTATLLKEFLGHTRMSRLPVVAIAHWFTAIGFLVLFSTLVNAFFQLVWPEFRLPIIGHFPPFEWLVELLAWGCLIGIILLMVIRQRNHPRNAAGAHGRRSRFFGSTWWQAYFVEIIILLVSICIVSLRSQEAALVSLTEPGTNVWLHFPLTAWLAPLWASRSAEWIGQSIVVVATIKILVSFTWMIVVSLTPTMGVAWHRFLAFFNIWFKRHADGRTSLGELQPMRVNGELVTAENLEEIMEGGEDDDEMPKMGVGHVQDYTWKQLLDFSTCTECGRCQSQCPAWNTDKPLSPKMLMMTMRDHANEMAPWLQATADQRAGLPEHTRKLAEVPLVGATGYDAEHPLTAYDALGPDAIIDADVLWSCTTCGACVEQCPVDIEHVDAIVDMRRHQVLIESAFPAEFGGLFKNLESKQNPWGMAPKMRLDWAKGLEFDIPIVGQDVEDLADVDYLFWVGCAGAFEDRAKKTTRAVAELLDEAGVSFAVLGEGEACTGDAARRAGNEILFQMLAAQNVEMLNEAGATKIVVTCAHCFNTLRNEYPQNGGRYEVLHHTQLLNRLVREKRLVPVARPEERPGLSSAKNVASTAGSVTYHDPCYLGRHNNVYAPPRELIGALPGVELREMPRHGMKSFCCGAGGARMWAEENLGTRINLNRTAEAVETGADRIAVGCPFCRVMLSDGLTSMQSEGTAREEVEVVDIAQMLLASVRRGKAPDAAPSEAIDVDSAGEHGTAGVDSPAEVRKEARDEAAEGGPAGVETSDAAERAAAEATDAAAPRAEAAPQATPPAAPAKGKMSAADALAMMQAGAAAPAAPAPDAAAAPPATGQAPSGATSDAPKAMPKGKMSAADALAALGGAAAAGAAAAAAASSGSDESPSAAEPADTTPTPAAPAAPAASAEMPKGKMSAADALAMMQAGAGAPAAPTPTEPAGSEASAPAAPAPADPEAPETAPAAPSSQAAPTAPAASAPAAKPGKAAMPTGKMSASDALAAMMAGGGAAAGQDEPASSPAPETESTPTPEATTPETPAATTTSETAPEPEAPKGETAPEPQTTTPEPAAPPTQARAASPKAPMPSGRMSASDALAAMMAGAGAAAPAEEPAPEPGPDPAPAAQTPVEDTTPTEVVATPSAVDTPEAQPASEPAPTAETAAVPTEQAEVEQAEVEQAEVEQAEVDAEPVPAAPAETSAPAVQGAPRAGAAAWQKLVEAAGGKPIAASEAMKILGQG